MNQASTLIEKIRNFNGIIVSDNIRVIAQKDFDSRKMATFLGNDYHGIDFTTLADLVACEMDTLGQNYPFSLDEVVDIILNTRMQLKHCHLRAWNRILITLVCISSSGRHYRYGVSANC